VKLRIAIKEFDMFQWLGVQFLLLEEKLRRGGLKF
jgi:hypothetical protein